MIEFVFLYKCRNRIYECINQSINFLVQMPFDARHTTTELFHTGAGRTLNVSMMHQRHTFPYADLDEIQSEVLMVKFEDHYRMLIFLPRRNTDMKEALTNIRQFGTRIILKKLEERLMDFKLIKFKFETQIGLNSILALDSLFGEDSELNMAPDRRNSTPYVVQKAIVSFVDSRIDSESLSAPMFDHAEGAFITNRPFLFIILDVFTDDVVFLGHFDDPEAET